MIILIKHIYAIIPIMVLLYKISTNISIGPQHNTRLTVSDRGDIKQRSVLRQLTNFFFFIYTTTAKTKTP